jgi:hypothetical protein
MIGRKESANESIDFSVVNKTLATTQTFFFCALPFSRCGRQQYFHVNIPNGRGWLWNGVEDV